MAIVNRFPQRTIGERIMLVDGDSTKQNKFRRESSRKNLLYKIGFICAALATVAFVYKTISPKNPGQYESSNTGLETVSKMGMKGSSVGKSKNNAYELFPFLVDAKTAMTKDNAVLSTITNPKFPTIENLEGCKLAFRPSNPPRGKNSEWRKKFWIPSFPASGASDPTRKGDLLRKIIEGLFTGDDESYKTPVKNFHASIANHLKRCKGISETVGCTCNHPQTSTSPERRTDEFRSEVILSIRNPSTAIPAFFASKNIAYHKATKQIDEEGWRNQRDEHFDGVFEQWMDTIKFWRGSAKESSYYFTSIYVAFEDLVTTDMLTGVSTIQELSNLISGRIAANDKDDDFFETSSLQEDYKCIWYRTAKDEWVRQQAIVGDYIPAYTQAQKNKMVKALNAYADEVEKDSFERKQDRILVSLLRRYATQIEAYVRVDDVEAQQRQ